MSIIQREFAPATSLGAASYSRGANIIALPSGAYFTCSGNATSRTTLSVAVDRMWIFPFVPSRRVAIDQVAIQVTTQGAANMKFGVYSANQDSGLPAAALVETSDISINVTANTVVTGVLSFTFEAGVLYWVFGRASATAGAVRSLPAGALPALSTATGTPNTPNICLARTNATYATAASALSAWAATEVNTTTPPDVLFRVA